MIRMTFQLRKSKMTDLYWKKAEKSLRRIYHYLTCQVRLQKIGQFHIDIFNVYFRHLMLHKFNAIDVILPSEIYDNYFKERVFIGANVDETTSCFYPDHSTSSSPILFMVFGGLEGSPSVHVEGLLNSEIQAGSSSLVWPELSYVKEAVKSGYRILIVNVPQVMMKCFIVPDLIEL